MNDWPLSLLVDWHFWLVVALVRIGDHIHEVAAALEHIARNVRRRLP